MTDRDWMRARIALNVPYGWTLRSSLRPDGRWVLTATRRGDNAAELPCGHRSMQVTTTQLPLAVALMAARVRFHREYCR